MPRPLKSRVVASTPTVTDFKPRGVPMRDLQEVYLQHDGFEALRLSEIEGLDQSDAARRMGISRQTFGRILANARRVVARAVVEGMALRIQGGEPRILGRARNPSAPPTERKPSMSKIAVTASGPTLDSAVDSRFGRAAGFLIVDPSTGDFQYLSNAEAGAQPSGAGIQAVQTIARAGATVLLTGRVGPKALQALQAAGIEIGEDFDGMKVREAVDRFAAGVSDPTPSEA